MKKLCSILLFALVACVPLTAAQPVLEKGEKADLSMLKGQQMDIFTKKTVPTCRWVQESIPLSDGKSVKIRFPVRPAATEIHGLRWLAASDGNNVHMFTALYGSANELSTQFAQALSDAGMTITFSDVLYTADGLAAYDVHLYDQDNRSYTKLRLIQVDEAVLVAATFSMDTHDEHRFFVNSISVR